MELSQDRRRTYIPPQWPPRHMLLQAKSLPWSGPTDEMLGDAGYSDVAIRALHNASMWGKMRSMAGLAVR